MDTTYANVAGLDVHHTSIQCAVRCQPATGKVLTRSRSFGTMTRQLRALADYLESLGVTHVALESTGVLWKPVWNILEGQDHRRKEQIQRINRRVHHDLVDRVQHECDDEHGSDVLPALPQQLVPASPIRKNGPQEGRLARARILETSSDRKGDGHRRLYDQPESHRPVSTTDEILPSRRNASSSIFVVSAAEAICGMRGLTMALTGASSGARSGRWHFRIPHRISLSSSAGSPGSSLRCPSTRRNARC
jgi:hypothetical protein